MSEAFLKVVNMSISAGWLVLAVLALRLILKKAPKWVNVLLWSIVGIRLICPFSIESALSLIPSTETISPEIMMDWTPEISTGIEPLDQVVNPVISTSFAPQGMASANPLQILIPVAANLWLLGVLILLAYTAISYLTLRHKLRTAVIQRDNIFQCETVSSPFVLGILKPRIYLPYAMDGKNLAHVIAHEQAHIRRKDHWWKPLGFLLLTVYWFNPLMWVAYILLCRDIELACDEKVIAELGNEQRADYTEALVACAVNRRMIAACPLAFGEVGVKDRVKSIMNYKKPAFWIIVTALVVCVVVAVCFLTDPNPSREFSMSGENVSDLNPEAIVERILDIENIDNSGVYMNSMNFSLQVDSNFNWADSQAVTYFFTKSKTTYKGQLRIFPHEEKYFLTEPSEGQEQQSIFLLRHYLEAIKYLPQYDIRQMAPADQYIIQQREEGTPKDYERVITYTPDGAKEIEGWNIHLQIQPLHQDGDAYSGTGEEVIDVFYSSGNGRTTNPAVKWFDYTEDPSGMSYEQELKIQLDEFPGITFKYIPYDIIATNSWEDSNSVGKSYLISGLPIWNAYFCDLTGDGLPEICSQVSYGSGIIDNRVIIHDYANGASYSLIDRGYHDYYLRMNEADGHLYVDKKVYNSDEVVSSGRLVYKDGCIMVEETDIHASLVMVPTDTKFQGLHAGALLLPIDGNIYRYLLTDNTGEGVTAEKLIFEFKEPDLKRTIDWEVYSLKEYPDLSVVMILSKEEGPWLCTYCPPGRCSDTALTDAINAGYVVMEDGAATHGQDVWKSFFEDTQKGMATSVIVAHYQTLDPERCDTAYFEAFNQDYPSLTLYHLNFDGTTFTLSFTDSGVEYIRTYEYLMKLEASGTPLVGNTEHKSIVHYALTHDTEHTWKELWGSLASSASPAAIDFYPIYAETVN